MNKTHKLFLLYLVNYLGIALIAGSVVHAGTLLNGTLRYFALGVLGIVLLVVGNIIEARMKGEKIDMKYFLLVLCLSFGTGFVSGGIQHYIDNPLYAGSLLALGGIMAYIAFILKMKETLKPSRVLFVVVVALVVFSASYMLDVRTSSIWASNSVERGH